MTIELFDVQASFGGATPGSTQFITTDELLHDMQQCDITNAMVRIDPTSLDVDFVWTNQQLQATCQSNPQLSPCLVIAPKAGRDLPLETTQVDDAISAGAPALFPRPWQEGWMLEEWASHDLFQAMEDRTVPMFGLHAGINFSQIATIAKQHPRLPIIYAALEYRCLPTLVSLAKAFPNIHISIGNNLIMHRLLELFSKELSVQQLLFGTGFPSAEPMCAVTQLMYADISDEEKALIGSGNMKRLIAGIQR